MESTHAHPTSSPAAASLFGPPALSRIARIRRTAEVKKDHRDLAYEGAYEEVRRLIGEFPEARADIWQAVHDAVLADAPRLNAPRSPQPRAHARAA